MKVRIEQAMRACKVKMVAVGGMHVLAILENNNGAYAWGKNKQG
jgi:alpha-tubulin suppressor-like RCC1 family protein